MALGLIIGLLFGIWIALLFVTDFLEKIETHLQKIFKAELMNFENQISASGTVTEDPPDNTTGYLVDSNATWIDHEHNDRILLITSGRAKGYFYSIDGTDGAKKQLMCSDLPNSFSHLGNNLYVDGVRAGDMYSILFRGN